MKFCSMNGPSESEVESLLMSPCPWSTTQTGSQDQYLLDGHKLLLEHDLDSLPSDSEQKSSLDVLDNLLLNSTSLNALSDLKPLPPFTGYTGHLSINGISGHHYHAIAQRLPDESNNNYMQSAYQTNNGNNGSNGNANGICNGLNGTTAIQLAAATSVTSPLSCGSGGSLSSNGGSNGNNANSSNSNQATDHNIVSSSTCLPESVLSPEAADACLNDVKLFADSHLDSKLYSLADSCQLMSALSGGCNGGNNNNTHGNDSASLNSNNSGLGGPTMGLAGNHNSVDSLQTAGVRIYADAKDLSEYVDMNSIDDIAAIIGSAIADTTVPNQLDKEDGNDTRDSWMDLDAWIDGSCIQQDGKLIVSPQDALSEFILPHSPIHSSSSTLQSLLTHGYMPLLQNRLQNGPPTGSASSTTASSASSSTSAANSTTSSNSTSAVASSTTNLLHNNNNKNNEAPSSTSFCSDLPTSATSSTSSPPGSVVSTTDNLMINPRYLTNSQNAYHHHHHHQMSLSSSLKDGLCSPDLLGNFPHTTTVTPTGTPKAKRSRSQKKTAHGNVQPNSLGSMGNANTSTAQQLNAISPSSLSGAFSASDLSNLLGKEKPVHRCSICNRGFLNKSNIKVHLRTHTGEKPFRCEVCAKAFRQKAHLLKHQQIHKRIGRD